MGATLADLSAGVTKNDTNSGSEAAPAQSNGMERTEAGGRPWSTEGLKETRVARVRNERQGSKSQWASRQGPQGGRLCRLLADYT